MNWMEKAKAGKAFLPAQKDMYPGWGQGWRG